MFGLQQHQRQQTPPISSAQQQLQQIARLRSPPGIAQTQRSVSISGTSRPATQHGQFPQNRSFSSSAATPTALANQRPLTAQTVITNQMATPPTTARALQGAALNAKTSGADGGASPYTPTFAKLSQPVTSTNAVAQGTFATLPPSPPLTRSATRSRSSIATAIQQLHGQEVDYLIQNGGLDLPISISFSPDVDPHEISYRPGSSSGEVPQVTHAPGKQEDQAKDEPPLAIFAPLHYSLDAYSAILASGGSVAVGTGYRSVARRLLERVEGIFARDIGLPWGDVLELLRGKKRRERLPVLQVIPMGSFQKLPPGGDNNKLEGEAGTIVGAEDQQRRTPSPPVAMAVTQKTPVQGPDGEVAVHQMLSEGEKIRTKTKVEEWLEETETVLSTTINGHITSNGVPHCDGQPPVSGAVADQLNQDSQLLEMTPEELEEVERHVSKLFLELLNDQPDQKDLFAHYLEDEDLLQRTILALRRLYPTYPPQTITRPIAALYRILNPNMHYILEAIAVITKGELDLLNSGRFDGFLDEKDVIPADEEKELEVLEILDGNIFRTMERLEDEIESLHVRAEEVRRRLRVRKEAIVRKMILAIKDTSTGGGAGSASTARPNTGHTTTSSAEYGGITSRPATSGKSNIYPFPPAQVAAPLPPRSDYFEGIDISSTIHPLMPDDSASNFGHRHRRRITRKQHQSSSNDDGEHTERPRTSSGQMKLAKQMAKDREKKGNREKLEKERERREKEEMRKLKQAAERAAAGISAGSGISPSTVVGVDIKDRVGTPPLLLPGVYDKGPKRKKSKEDREREREKDKVPAGEHKKKSGDQNRGIETATMGETTLIGASNDMLAPLVNVSSKEKDKAKKKEKKAETQPREKEPITETEGECKPKRKESTIERIANFRFSKFLSADHEDNTGDSPVGGTGHHNLINGRPGTSSGGQGLRPGTSGSIQVTSSAAGYEREKKERKRDKDRDRNNTTIPEEHEEVSSNERPQTSSHHLSSHRRRHHHNTSLMKSNVERHGVEDIGVFSEPEDILGGGRLRQELGGFAGVFSDDERGTHGEPGGDATVGIKHQLKRSLRRSKDKKVEKVEFEDRVDKEKEREKKEKDRDKDREKDKDKDKDRKKDRDREKERKEKDRDREKEKKEDKERDKEKKEKEKEIKNTSAAQSALTPEFPQIPPVPSGMPASFIHLVHHGSIDSTAPIHHEPSSQEHQQQNVPPLPTIPPTTSGTIEVLSLPISNVQQQSPNVSQTQQPYVPPRPSSEAGTIYTATLTNPPTLATSTTAVENYYQLPIPNSSPFGTSPMEALRRNTAQHQRSSSGGFQRESPLYSLEMERPIENSVPRVDNPITSAEGNKADNIEQDGELGYGEGAEEEATTIGIE